jgi:hypothetical protein
MHEIHVEPLGATPVLEGYVRHAALIRAHDGDQELWWITPEDARPLDESWLLAPGLLLGMLKGEAVHLHGRVSPRLVASMDAMQERVTPRYDVFHRVPFTVDVEATPEEPPGKDTISCFSAGVDTFYTAVRARDEIDELLFVHGFESSQRDDEQLFTLLPAVTSAATALGMPLRLAETNALDMLRVHAPTNSHFGMPILVSTVMLMGSRFGRFLVPAAHDRIHEEEGASTLSKVLPYWATEHLDVVLHGVETRVEKLRLLKDSPAAMRWLRVCWSTGGLYNCGHCPKCIRTIVNLELAGAAGRCATMPKKTTWQRIVHRSFARGDAPNYGSYVRENLDEATAQGRHDLVEALQASTNPPTPSPWTRPLRALDRVRRRWSRSWRKQRTRRALARHRRAHDGRHLFLSLGSAQSSSNTSE